MAKIKITKSTKGGEDPPKKSTVYTSHEQIAADNNFARNFLARHGAPQYLVNNSVVARNIGDPIPQFEYPNGKPSILDKPILQTELPFGVTIKDVVQVQGGKYGYYHPQNGNFVQVDPQAIYLKYGGGK